ncbi:hypothetical protein ACJW30_05G057700 [Castanea mollissima]
MSDPGQGCGVGVSMVGRGDGCGVGEGMVGVGDGCGVDEGMVGLGDGCGVDGEGSGVGTIRGLATGGRGRHPAEVVLVLGPVGVGASSFRASGIGGCTRSIACTAVRTSVMSLWSSVPTG